MTLIPCSIYEDNSHPDRTCSPISARQKDLLFDGRGKLSEIIPRDRATYLMWKDHVAVCMMEREKDTVQMANHLDNLH